MAHPERDPTDAQLVARSLAGDKSAFGRLVARHRPGVARLLSAMFANLGGVEDLVQESFLRAYLDLARLRDPARFGAWVRGIAVNLARMELRAGRLSFVSWEAARDDGRRPQPSPEALAQRRELVRRVRAAIAALPPAEREAIEHVYLDELSHKEAAAELNTSVGAVKVRVHRGRRRLRAALDVQPPAAEGQAEVTMSDMIEVTVQDVLAKLAEDEMLLQAEMARPAREQGDVWLQRFKLHRVVLLAEKGGARLLPIWVGPPEGEGIVIQLRGRSTARPITFDLMKALLAVGNMTLEGVAISRLHENVFYGTLLVRKTGDDPAEVDCRPSDAINLALRMDAPIFVAPEIMDGQGVTPAAGAGYGFLPCEAGERWVSLLAAPDEEE